MSILAQAAPPNDWLELLKTYGLGLGVLAVILWLLIRGKLHTDGEFQREVERGNKIDAKLDRVLAAQEEIIEVVKEAVNKRAEIKNLSDLAKLADYARDQGLIK